MARPSPSLRRPPSSRPWSSRRGPMWWRPCIPSIRVTATATGGA